MQPWATAIAGDRGSLEQFANAAPNRRDRMTTFDERQKSFEKKFALDEELKFRSEQRRNRLLGEWAAGKLGMTGPAVDGLRQGPAQGGLGDQGR